MSVTKQDYNSEAIKRLGLLVENLIARYKKVCEENDDLRAEIEELKNERKAEITIRG